MKFYSEVTGELFDKEEELKLAEAKFAYEKAEDEAVRATSEAFRKFCEYRDLAEASNEEAVRKIDIFDITLGA